MSQPTGVRGALRNARARAEGTPYIVYFAALVLVAFLADPYSFTRAWNQGRSAVLAVVPLVFLESGRRSFARLDSARKASFAWTTVAVATIYYFTVAQSAVYRGIEAWGTSLGVNYTIVDYSWLWGIDYAFTTVFLVALLLLDRGSKIITPLIYTFGMTCFLFIDVLLPENSLGPFGYVVPPVLRVVAAVLNVFSPGVASATSNILVLQNNIGSMRLQVFWPSAGLDGIVIGMLVVLAICVKAGTGWYRGTVYMVIGILGSFLVNVLRLVLLAEYALSDITNEYAFQNFHSVVGELVFIPWIIAFVVIILRRESRIVRGSKLGPAV